MARTRQRSKESILGDYAFGGDRTETNERLSHLSTLRRFGVEIPERMEKSPPVGEKKTVVENFAPFARPAGERDGTKWNAQTPAQVAKSMGTTEEALVDALTREYGSLEAGMAAAQRNHALTTQFVQAQRNAAGNALGIAGEQILQAEVPPELLQVMGVTLDGLEKRYGTAAAEAKATQWRSMAQGGNIKGVLTDLGLPEEEATRIANGSTSSAAPGWLHQPIGGQVPVVKDLPNAAAAGAAGAGATALATYLLANGLQQPDPYAYQAALQQQQLAGFI